jgi:anti-sigma factor RsiW
MSADERELDLLLGAYALDAIDDDERRAVDEYLRVNPAAAQEVSEYRETASMLAWTSMSAPAGLWERIADSLDDGVAPVPSGPLAAVIPSSTVPARRRRRMAPAMWPLAAAAVAALVVVGVQQVSTQSNDGPPLVQAYNAAIGDRDSRRATLANEDGTLKVDAVVDSDGHGYLQMESLPALPSSKTYQLWGVVDDKAISLGILGPNPEIEPFAVTGNLTALVITTEVAGGVISDGNMDGALSAALS